MCEIQALFLFGWAWPLPLPLPLRWEYSSLLLCCTSFPEHCTRWREGSTKGMTFRLLRCEKVRSWSSATLVGGGVEGGSEE